MKRSPRRSAAQWAELVAEFSGGTESERDFCTRRGLRLATLRKWRYHFQSGNQADADQSPARFVKVNLPDAHSLHGAAVLCIGTDIRLECPASFDVSSLAQLALAVHHGR